MADSLLIMCPGHGCPLMPDHDDPGRLRCPEGACVNEVRIGAADGFPFSPLTSLEQGAATHHELVLSYERTGFSRSESMQILCTIITAHIMKDRGSE